MQNSKVYMIAAAMMLTASPAAAASVLGSATGFAVLGGAAVTNTGSTSIVGDLGSYPGAVTGLASVALTGTLDQGNPAAQAAQLDAASASAALTLLPVGTNLTGQDLGTVGVLTPGVYRFSSSAQLTGALVLDFASDPAGSFVFQIGSTLTTASDSSVTVLNGSPRSSIYFEVGSSATLGTGTAFAGNILADQSITVGTSSTICGRAIAENGAVTLDTNSVSIACKNADFASVGFSGSGVPESQTWAMMLCGFGAIGYVLRRARQIARVGGGIEPGLSFFPASV